MSSNIEIPDEDIAEIKEIRVAQQALNDRINDLHLGVCGDAANLPLMEAWKRGKEVRHWLGETLGNIRDHRPDLQHPYPDADNPESAEIAPTADTP